MKVSIIGGGSFGTAISILLGEKNLNVSLYARDKEVVSNINTYRKNEKYIKDISIPQNVKGTDSLSEATEGADYIVLAVPSHAIRGVSKELKGILKGNEIIVNLAKGMEENTFKRLSEVIEEELPKNPIVILSGPCHAEEVAKNIPTAVVATSKNHIYAEKVQDLFMTSKFRVYTGDDLIGVEIGGAVKNIIALAAGISDGIGFGDNTKAALMTRGMSEIIRIGEALGGNPETFSGLTGIGDLIVTCTSMHSRNRRAGILIGSGKSKEEAMKEVGMVVEGVKACKVFYELKNKLGVDMPITELLYNVLFHGEDPEDGVHKLMTRDKKKEL